MAFEHQSGDSSDRQQNLSACLEREAGRPPDRGNPQRQPLHDGVTGNHPQNVISTALQDVQFNGPTDGEFMLAETNASLVFRGAHVHALAQNNHGDTEPPGLSS